MIDKNFLISVYSPLGGQGVTLLTIQLAAYLEKYGTSGIVDCNGALGVAYAYMDQGDSEKPSSRQQEFDSELSSLISSTQRHKGDDPSTPATDEELSGFFKTCRRKEFKYTLLDLPHDLDIAKQAFQNSDLIIVLGNHEKYGIESRIKLIKLLSEKAKTKRMVHVLNANATSPKGYPLNSSMRLLILATIIAGAVSTDKAAMENPFYYYALIIGIGIGLVFYVCLPWFQAAVKQKKKLSLLKTATDITIFHELPNDSKSARWCINQGTVLPKHTDLGNP